MIAPKLRRPPCLMTGTGPNSYARHMGGQPNKPNPSKTNAVIRTVDTSPVYGRRQATSDTIDREIAESVQTFRDQAKQRRIAAAIKRQSQKRK